MGSPGLGGGPRVNRALLFGLLGPFLVEVAGQPVELNGTRTKAVLAILLVHANSVVTADRLIDDLWAGQPTPGALTTLQGYVSDMRRALSEALGEPAPVFTRRPGYVIRVEPAQLDVLRFESLVVAAKAADRDQPAQRAQLLRQALAEWRGPALADFADEPFARSVATRLEDDRIWALEERVEAELGTGCHGELVTELGTLTAENPLRERLWGQLMLALYRCGRQAEALRTYQDLRRRLGDELAIEPNRALQHLEVAILKQDPSLDLPIAGTASTVLVPPDLRQAAPRHNLPVKLTRFVGRGRELEEIRTLLAGVRLLTLAGSSGSGKTRLAVELVAGETAQWRDGVYFVDLSALQKPELLPAAVAASMGLSERGADVVSVCEHLGDTQVLLLLDNCEHLIDACAELVEAILSRCPNTTVMATSQEELRIGSERVWRVPPLSLPARRPAPEPEHLLASEAVQLFLDRAPTLGEAREPATLEAVAEVCQRLDGIPLAIELAASLVSALPLDEIVRRLGDRFALLVRSNRGAVTRHRTLRAAIDWSYELLAESERHLFDGLSVFVGQFSVEAAEAAAGCGELLTDLSALVSKSLVSTVPGPGGSRRYQLLDSLRLYGLERLAASGREADARERHAAYYMSFVVAAECRHHGPDPADSAARVLRELPNIRAALEWSFSDGDLEVGVQLAGALRCGYFARMGQLTQARAWLEAALAPDAGLPEPLRLKALTAAMTIAFSLGDYRWSATIGEEAVTLAEQLDDVGDRAFALMARGSAAIFEGKVDRAVECFERSTVYCQRLGDEWTRGSVLTYWGAASRRVGDDELCKRQLEEALAIFRALHDDYNQVVPLIQLALLAQHLGDLDEAERASAEALEVARRLGDRQLSHGAYCIAGLAELALGRREQADRLLRSSLTVGRGLEHFLMVAMAVEGFAVLAHHQGKDTDAARLWGFTDELRSTQGIPLFQERLDERERLLAGARTRVGIDAVDQALAAGRRMTYPQVLHYVRADPDQGEGLTRQA